MKILINYNWNDKFEIDFYEFDNVGKIIGELKKRNQYFGGEFLIYQNIILNTKKLLKFYEISENSEIWFGQIGNYLKEDEIIVELFISIIGGDIIHIIVKKSDSISNIKSILNKVIENISNIWDVNEHKLEDDKIISDIDFDNEYYKLIICLESDCGTFVECCRRYDRYLITFLLRIFIQYNINFKKTTIIEIVKTEMSVWFQSLRFDEMFRFLTKYSFILEKLDKVGFNIWNEELIKVKNAVILNPIFDCNVPLAFVNSRFLLWEEIFDVVDNLFTEFFDSYKLALPRINIARILTSSFVSMSIINYIINNQSNFTNKSMKNILIDILDYCENVFNQDNVEFEIYVEHFVNLFIIKKHSFDAILEIIREFPRTRIYSLLLNFHGTCYPISPGNVKSNLDAKKTVSYYTKLSINHLHFINPTNQIKEEYEDEEYDGTEIEFLSSMDNIEIKTSKLGSGAFGEILLCEDKLSGKRFVLKMPQNQNPDNLSRDISIQCRLKDSKNLLRYLELYRHNGSICMAMKYLSGGSIALYLTKNKNISEQQIAKWCHQILLQINELHEQEIIHRDIKCDNIVLDENDNAYLIDFGISKYINDLSIDSLKSYIVVTPNYMAPEVINCENYSNKIDIWSFGASVIEMVTGKMPYSDMTTIQATLYISKTKTIKYTKPKTLSNELKQFIDSCIKSNADERFSAKQLIESKFISKYCVPLNPTFQGN